MDHRSKTRFPVPHKQISLDIKGCKTDLVICSYDDHFLVMATQIGSMGTILHARKEQGMAINPTFSVSVIFGKRDEPMLVACARQLIEHISSSGSSRTLLLSLGLKDHSMETLKAIVSTVIENRLWEFVSCVHNIKILSSAEVQQLSLDGDLGNVQGNNQACSGSGSGNAWRGNYED